MKNRLYNIEDSYYDRNRGPYAYVSVLILWIGVVVVAFLEVTK